MDNSSPILVTIYVLTYKKFSRLYSNLWSIVQQDYPCIELLVSDDGSENFPKDEIEAFLCKNCRNNIVMRQVFANSQNVGTVKHINFLLSKAHGELFIPLSADDEFYNNHIVSDIVAEYGRTHFNVLSTSRVAVDVKGRKMFLYPHFLDRYLIKKYIQSSKQQFYRFMQGRFNNFASGSTMTIRTDFLRMIGGHDEKYVLWEDGPFIAKTTSLGYRINYRLDLVTIKYGIGGISTGGAHGHVLEILGKDGHQYMNDKSEYKKKIDDRSTLRFMEYDESYNEKTGFSRFIWRLKYADVFIQKQWYALYESIFMRYDKFYLHYHSLD